MTPTELRSACRNAHPVDARRLLAAANEIERLRTVLETIADNGGIYSGGKTLNGLWCADVARRALEETK